MKVFFYVVFPLFLMSCNLVQCETWTTPIDVSAIGSDSVSPRISINDSSQIVAVWLNGQAVQSATMNFGGTWSSSSYLRSSLYEICTNPRVKINNSGQILAIWGGGISVEPYAVVMSSSSGFGEGWTDPIGVYIGERDIDAEMAFNDLGEGVAVVGNIVAPTEIKVSKWILGGNWGDFKVLSEDGYAASEPQVVMNSNGRIAVIWKQMDDSNQRIYGMISAFVGYWPTIWPLYGKPLSLAGQDSETPEVAINDNNQVIVIWSRSDSLNKIIQTVQLEVGEKWGSPVNLSIDGQDAETPRIAINSSGQIVAVWSRSNGTNKIVQAATKNYEGSWSTPVDLSAVGQDASRPQVALNEAGQIVCVWKCSDGTNTIIQAATCNFGGSWSSPVDLSEAGQDANSPQIALNSGGQAVAVWSRSNGTNTIIQSATTKLIPLPPTNLMGVQKKLLTGTQISYFNRLFWNASLTANVSYYYIYRNGIVMGTVNSGRNRLMYEDKNQAQGVPVNYSITAVSSGGGESVVANITVP